MQEKKFEFHQDIRTGFGKRYSLRANYSRFYGKRGELKEFDKEKISAVCAQMCAAYVQMRDFFRILHIYVPFGKQYLRTQIQED